MVQFLPAPDIAGQLQALLFGPLQQGIGAAFQGLERNRQRQQQQEGIASLAQQLGLDENQIAEISKLDPKFALKGLEFVQKDAIKQKQNDLLNEFLGVRVPEEYGSAASATVPTELTPEQGADTRIQVENLETPQGIPALSLISDREELRNEHQANAARIIQNADAMGQQNAKFLLDLNQQLFESRDSQLDNEEKQRLKNVTEANKRFAESADKSTEAALKAQDVKLALQPVSEAIASNQSGPTVKNLLAEAANGLPDHGLTGSLKNVLLTPAQQVFKVGQGSFFKSLKDSFGANVSTVETQMFMGSLFQFATDPDAQQFAVEYQNILADRTIAASEIKNNLLDEDGIPVKNARKLFEKRMKDFLKVGEDRLKQTNWWKKTNLSNLQKEAVSTQKKRDFLRDQMGRQ